VSSQQKMEFRLNLIQHKNGFIHENVSMHQLITCSIFGDLLSGEQSCMILNCKPCLDLNPGNVQARGVETLSVQNKIGHKNYNFEGFMIIYNLM